MYVIIVSDRSGRAFVAAPGSEKSYTPDLTKAKTFTTRVRAEQHKCGNESIVNVNDLLQIPI